MQSPTRISDPVRRKRGRRWLTYGIGLGLWASGTIWLVYHYFLKQRTEFGLAENPLTHWWLALHGLFAFATLWLFGLLWGQHILGAWKTKRHRVSGSLLVVVLAVLIVTGYLLYYAGGDKTQAVVSAVHWVVGLPAPLSFLLHRFVRGLRVRLYTQSFPRRRATPLFEHGQRDYPP